MVEWQPIVGTIPPLDQAQWQEVFEKYQRTPEYQKVNRGMSLDEFKGIFWWEYFHRLLGRAIGVVFFVPLLYFALRGKIERALAGRLLLIFVLGALQGAVGWYMVKSGLVDDPRVSQYRLTAHLGLAFLIYAAMFWTALELLSAERAPPSPARRRLHALCRWAERARLRYGADRRTGGRDSCGARVQHLPAHERPRGAARIPHARAVVPESVQQHGGRAVRPSSDCLAAVRARTVVLVWRAPTARLGPRARLACSYCWWCSQCRSRWASRRCCW